MNKIGKVISIATIFAVLTYIFVMPASAALLGKDGFYYEFSNGNAILKEYHSSNTEVEIPSKVYDYNVVEISDHVFLRNTAITSVTIPESVTKIGDSTFYGCSNLEKVVIPSSVTSFGSSIFANCEKLTIECYTGSAAEAYAKDNNISYKLIDGNVPDDTDTDTDTQTDTDTDTNTKTDTDTDTNSDTDGKIYKYGDVDLDGDINSADSLKILRRSVKLEDFTEVQDELADVDGDGNISSSDALDVLRYSVHLTVNSHVGEELNVK